jgi:hypothetical protein
MEEGDETGVPSLERQRWLLEQTRILLSAGGADAFLSAPLLEPTPKFFPDGWLPHIEAAEIITRRLLDYAGLDQLDLYVQPFLNEPSLPDEEEERPRYIVGFFRGIEDGVCLFGIHEPALEDPEYLAGVMAHEVAHAFRHHHQLIVANRDDEEELTDLTSVFLGSGALTANLAERVVVERSPDVVSLRRSASGYLSVEDFAFALALQLRARDGGQTEIERLMKFLGSSQAYCLRHALRRLDELELDQQTLRHELGITTTFERTTRAIGPARALPNLSYLARPWGRLAYSARQSRVGLGAGLGVVAGTVVGLMLTSPSDHYSIFIAMAVGPMVGAFWGRRPASGRCSNANCRELVPRHASECPGCKRYLLGTLDSPPRTFEEGSHRGKRVKRWIGNRRFAYASWGGVIAAYAVFILMGFDLSAAWLWIVPLTAIAGALVGRRVRIDSCGGRDCETILEDFVQICPRCLAEVRGEARTDLELL